MMPFIDEIGTEKHFNHFPAAWAHAMDTPFQWVKQVASHLGGTRNAMIVSWPARYGEGGTVRHQTPRANLIKDNSVAVGTLGFGDYAIWLGSRIGRRPYCHLDDGYPFGSSLDDRDFANDNLVSGNTFDPPGPETVRDEGEGNVVLP